MSSRPRRTRTDSPPHPTHARGRRRSRRIARRVRVRPDLRAPTARRPGRQRPLEPSLGRSARARSRRNGCDSGPESSPPRVAPVRPGCPPATRSRPASAPLSPRSSAAPVHLRCLLEGYRRSATRFRPHGICRHTFGRPRRDWPGHSSSPRWTFTGPGGRRPACGSAVPRSWCR